MSDFEKSKRKRKTRNSDNVEKRKSHPLYILIAAGVVNTLLNLLFVVGFRTGVAGVAIATGISNAVSAALIIRLLRKENEPFRLQLEKLKIHSA